MSKADDSGLLPQRVWLPDSVVQLAAVSPELENVEGAYWVRADSQPIPAGEHEDSGFSGFVKAALSPSGAAWQEWFERMGNKATMGVINATANLVCAEREIRSRTPSISRQRPSAYETCKNCGGDIYRDYDGNWLHVDCKGGPKGRESNP